MPGQAIRCPPTVALSPSAVRFRARKSGKDLFHIAGRFHTARPRLPSGTGLWAPRALAEAAALRLAFPSGNAIGIASASANAREVTGSGAKRKLYDKERWVRLTCLDISHCRPRRNRSWASEDPGRDLLCRQPRNGPLPGSLARDRRSDERRGILDGVHRTGPASSCPRGQLS